LQEQGGYVIEADKLAHELMLKGEPAYTEIVAAFGFDILDQSGEINRRALGAKVFANKSQLAKLEKIIHPRVIEKTRIIIKKAAELGTHTFMVIDAPLLIESGMNTLCDSLWLITAPDEIRITRITVRDSITEDAAKRRLQSRNGDAALQAHANITIENNGSAIALRSKIEVALKAMELKRHGWEGLPLLQL
jgi:dephospho-CoA kinase